MGKLATIKQKERDEKIHQVLHLLLFEKDENGKPYTVVSACEAMQVPRATWYFWEKQGHVDAVRQEVVSSIRTTAQDMILPRIRDIIGNLVSIAADGVSPTGSKVTTQNMLAAYDRIKPLMGLDRPIDDGGGLSAAEFLQQFSPKPLAFNAQNINFIYTGQSGPKMGELPSIEEPSDDNSEVVDGETTEMPTTPQETE